MSTVEVLPPFNPIDFDYHLSERAYDDVLRPNASVGRLLPVTNSNALLTSALHTTHDSPIDDGQTVSIAGLSPVLSGHPDLHLRNGVINASRLADVNEPDAEKAFFVADLSEVLMQHLRWQKCLPEVEPFYAVKCNPDPYVLRLLAALGTGFDCASIGEISQVLNIGGINPSRIIFANPCKAVSFVRNAAKVGVDMMTFDNGDELYKIARAHPHAKLVVRILTDDSNSLCRLGLKFGAPLDTVPLLLEKAKELALDVVGVSFHVGSGCKDPSAFQDAIMRARAAFDMGEKAGYTFSLLDVGGGFEDATFERNAQVLQGALDRFFPDRRKIRVIAEPGRFYVSNAFRLAANIIARRAPLGAPGDANVDGGDADVTEPKVMYYINDGVYGAFNCILFDHQTVHPRVLCLNGSFHVSSEVAADQCMSSVWGPTCDSIDCVCPTTMLPCQLQVGDWLAFDNMGAYTICAASQFNGFEKSKVVYTDGGSGAASNEVRRALRMYAQAPGAFTGNDG